MQQTKYWWGAERPRVLARGPAYQLFETNGTFKVYPVCIESGLYQRKFFSLECGEQRGVGVWAGD